MTSSTWIASNVFDPGDEGLLDIQSIARTRVTNILRRFPWLKRYWEVEDLVQHTMQSVVSVARSHPDLDWENFMKLCQTSFSYSLCNIRSRFKSEYFAYAITISEENPAVQNLPSTRGATLTPVETSLLRGKFISELKAGLLVSATQEQYDLIVNALCTPGNSFSDVLLGLGIDEDVLNGAVSVLEKCTRGVSKVLLNLEEVHHIWLEAR